SGPTAERAARGREPRADRPTRRRLSAPGRTPAGPGTRLADPRGVRPGGHLASAIALGGLAWASSGSLELAAGCFSGAFLIDVDHYLDSVTVEGQWRRPAPTSFLRYYFTNRLRRVVLPLHSIELLGALVVVAAVWP